MKFIEYKNHLTTLLESHNFPSHPHPMLSEIKTDKMIASFIEKNCDQHQNFDNDLLLDTIVGIYLSKNKFLNVKFNYKVQDSLLIENAPRLFLNLHSNFSPLTKLLLFKKQKINILSDFPDTVKKVLLYSGVKIGNVNIFKRDSTALLRAKYFLDKSECVSSTIDFQTSIPGIFNSLSDSMLKLAYQSKSQTFFGVNHVSDTGEVNYETIKINLEHDLEKNKEYILKFAKSFKKRSDYRWHKFDYANQDLMLRDAVSRLEKNLIIK